MPIGKSAVSRQNIPYHHSVAHVRNPPFRSSKYMCHFNIGPQALSTGYWKIFLPIKTFTAVLRTTVYVCIECSDG
jgi:hypothetical protein